MANVSCEGDQTSPVCNERKSDSSLRSNYVPDAADVADAGQPLAAWCWEDEWFDEASAQGSRDHFEPCQVPVDRSLPVDCVLARVLHVQSMGDVDFGRLYKAYDQLVEHFYDGSFSYDNVRWTHPQMTADWLDSSANTTDAFSPRADLALQQAVHLVQRYRISSTSRDCSVMIAFQRISKEYVGVVMDIIYF